MSAICVETGHKLDKQDIGLSAEEPIKDPARFSWRKVTKRAHFRLEVNAMTKPMKVYATQPSYEDPK